MEQAEEIYRSPPKAVSLRRNGRGSPDPPNMEEAQPASELSPEEWKKLGRSLQDTLHAANLTSTKSLHVTVSLRAEFPAVEGLPRGPQRARALREAFEALAQPLIERWKTDGGTEFQVHWIAGAVTVRLPLTAVVQAAHQERIVRIDLVEKKDALL